MTLARVLFVVAGAGGIAATGVALRRWHTGWGATETERGEQLPGDEYPVSRFGMRATRALTINATPA